MTPDQGELFLDPNPNRTLFDVNRPNTVREKQPFGLGEGKSIGDHLFPVYSTIDDPAPIGRLAGTVTGVGIGAYAGNLMAGPPGAVVLGGAGGIIGSFYPEAYVASMEALGFDMSLRARLRGDEFIDLAVEESVLFGMSGPVEVVAETAAAARRSFGRAFSGVDADKRELAQEMWDRYKLEMLPAQLGEGAAMKMFIRVNQFLPLFLRPLRLAEKKSRQELLRSSDYLIASIGRYDDHVMAGKKLGAQAFEVIKPFVVNANQAFRIGRDFAEKQNFRFGSPTTYATVKDLRARYRKAIDALPAIKDTDPESPTFGKFIPHPLKGDESSNPIHNYLTRIEAAEKAGLKRSWAQHFKLIEDIEGRIASLIATDQHGPASQLKTILNAIRIDLTEGVVDAATGRHSIQSLRKRTKGQSDEAWNAARQADLDSYLSTMADANKMTDMLFASFDVADEAGMAQKLGVSVTQRQMGLRYMEGGPLQMEASGKIPLPKLFETLFSREHLEPGAMKTLRGFLGKDVMKDGVATFLATGMVRALDIPVGHTSLLQALAEGAEFGKKAAGTLGKSLFFDNLLLRPGQGSLEAFKQAGVDPTQIQRFVRAFDKIVTFHVEDWATLAARRGQIHGVRAVVAGLIPTAMLTGGGFAAGGPVGAGIGLGTAVIMGLSLRSLSKLVSDPEVIVHINKSLDDRASALARRAAFTQILTHMPRLLDLNPDEAEAYAVLGEAAMGRDDRVNAWLKNVVVDATGKINYVNEDLARAWRESSRFFHHLVGTGVKPTPEGSIRIGDNPYQVDPLARSRPLPPPPVQGPAFQPTAQQQARSGLGLNPQTARPMRPPPTPLSQRNFSLADFGIGAPVTSAAGGRDATGRRRLGQ
jgi:hypothetical protein